MSRRKLSGRKAVKHEPALREPLDWKQVNARNRRDLVLQKAQWLLFLRCSRETFLGKGLLFLISLKTMQTS